jgi:hypothetical protein
MIIYDPYKFLVMPFGLCNAPSTFTTFIDFILHDKLDKFVIIYIDDILVYSKLVEKHVKHLKYVLKKLSNNNLYVNDKWVHELLKWESQFMSQEGVKLDPKKIQAIEKWQSLTMVKRVRSFLGLVNSYRKL